MNNQFNTTNIPTQHGIQMAQHVATSPPHPSAAVLNTFLNAQQQQQHQQLAAAGAIYSDPRQLQLSANTIDKNYYTAATLEALGTPQRFYTTANGAHHPNTILITNNFSHQQAGQSLNPDSQRNIRIVTTSSNPLNHANTSNLATSSSGFQHAQHVFDLNNTKQLQHLFPQHLLPQSGLQAAPTELLQQNFATQSFTSSQQQAQQNHATTSAIQMPHFYMSSENSVATNLNTSQKIINIPTNNVPSADGNGSADVLLGSGQNTNNPTVVLDRINICINNLYTDTSSSSASNSLASTPAQQPSPIIPAIQHKPIIENGPVLAVADIYESNVLVVDEPDSTTTATTPHTTPTTPESTPPSMPNVGNNGNNNAISTTSSINSPSTSYNYQKLDKSNIAVTKKQSFASAAQSIEESACDVIDCTENSNLSITPVTKNTVTVSQSNISQTHTQPRHNITTSPSMSSNASLTPLTPTSPEMSINNEYLNESKQTPAVDSPSMFSIGEDVFIKRHDERFYLGTVIDTARNQFLVRFDDKTEVWCQVDQMRKLCVSSSGNASSSVDEKSVVQPMCVACKRMRLDCKVEICERCGRGYHTKCTTETSPGSEIWLCKRCTKPMKLDDTSKISSWEEDAEMEAGFQLHYNLESLTWDDKHRSNVEQVYCYCGKSGKFHNMLQCWRCLNWYHVHCTQKFIGSILRGDCFFVFCCSVCNDGEEYLRRIQASWVDLIHLVLYNLSSIKKNHKYHHLLKDVYPYILEKRKMLPVPKEWISMPEKEFLEKLKNILHENNQFFMCGKEIKRDINSFALRIMEPPNIKKISLSSQDVFDDHFVFTNLKLPLLSGAQENVDFKFLNLKSTNTETTTNSKRKLSEDIISHDIYEFEDTSEDEIPIKHILEKVKKTNLTPISETACDVTKTSNGMNSISSTILEKMDVEDDNANDVLIISLPDPEDSALPTTKYEGKETPKEESKTSSTVRSPLGIENKLRDETPCNIDEKFRPLNTKPTERSSRKRKAFTLSKSYNITHLVESSSDENSSSSSKGTSLDLIIPPPKNFLGQNNPFRIISPKKNFSNASVYSSKKSVSFGIFNTTSLNFSSKLAALKSAGLFPKLSTSNLAKAAGQPRTVRTIKRRLSAKDITIGPNKEVRKRRTRRLSSNIEVISTTTINPIPTNFFPIQAKDLLAAAAASTTTAASLFTTQAKPTSSSNVSTSAYSSPNADTTNMDTTNAQSAIISQSTHGRRLRQRPQKNSPNASRRSSVSSNQSSISSASAAGGGPALQSTNAPHQLHEDFKQSVSKYFGIVNRIESGEQFSIRAKRQLANGQKQYLIEWGETQTVNPQIRTMKDLSEQVTSSQLMEVSTTS